MTRSNFEVLARKLESIETSSLDSLVRAFAACIVETYLAHPNRTRVLLEGVARLKLAPLVHEEKDRFAHVMALRAASFLPNESLEAIDVTMRFIADAAMGVIVFTSMRGGAIDEERVAEDLASMASELLHRRHPARG